MRFFLLFIFSVFASEERENDIMVKIEEGEYAKKTSKYIGVSYSQRQERWRAERWSKQNGKNVYNGASYKDEETAALASDTLARNLMANGEKCHKLNFPDEDTEVYPEKRSNYIGVSFHKNNGNWSAGRWSKNEKKDFYNGSYKDEETAALASDTLARKLISNGEKGHKLNFPDDDNEVHPEKKTNYIGVYYNKRATPWIVRRWSSNENRLLYNGIYKNEDTAAHASDTLARKLIENGEKGHKFNFPDDHSENQINKRKRTVDFKNSQTCKTFIEK